MKQKVKLNKKKFLFAVMWAPFNHHEANRLKS